MTTGTDRATTKGERLFGTGWTGGASAVLVTVYADRAEVVRFDDARTKTFPLAPERAERLREVWADTDGDVETATAVSLALNRMTGYGLGTFSTMASGEVGREWEEQMADIREEKRWRR